MNLVALRDRVEREWARREYLKRYMYEPARWAEECIEWPEGEALRSYQAEALFNIVRYRRESVRSLHGVGKTAIAALAVHWFATTRNLVVNKDWKVLTTASSWRQLTRYLWPEIHKWARRIKWDKVLREPYNSRTELLQLQLKLSQGEASALASDDPASMEGAHADYLMYIFDESKSIPSNTFDAAEGAFAGQGNEAYAFSISTPGDPSGRFYSIQLRRPGFEDWHVSHITLAQAQAEGKGFTPTEVEQRKRQWGEESAVFQNRVLGEFAASAEESVCPLEWVEAAMDRYRDFHESGESTVAPMCAVGVDIARAGRNETVFAPRIQNRITELRVFQGQDTMVTAGQIHALLAVNREAIAVVDAAGLGAGPVDRLVEQGDMVYPFNAAARTDYKGMSFDEERPGLEVGFVNLRSAAWWRLREMLNPINNVHPPVMLPPDDMLLGDLCTPRYQRRSDGRIEVEPKDNPREDSASSLTKWGTVALRLGRSPDRGDAVVQAFALDFLLPSLAPRSEEIPAEPLPEGIPDSEFAGNFLDDLDIYV